MHVTTNPSACTTQRVCRWVAQGLASCSTKGARHFWITKNRLSLPYSIIGAACFWKKKKKKKRLQFINGHALPLWRQKKRYQSTSIANPSITFAVRARVDAAGILSVRLETPRSKGGLHPGGQMPVRLKPRPPPRSKLGVYDSDLQQVGLAWMSPSHLERERRREDAGVVTASTLQEYPNVLRPGTLRSRCALTCDDL